VFSLHGREVETLWVLVSNAKFIPSLSIAKAGCLIKVSNSGDTLLNWWQELEYLIFSNHGQNSKSSSAGNSASYYPAGKQAQHTFYNDEDSQSYDVQEQEIALLKKHERTGRPIGADSFMGEVFFLLI
jgi:hypothetical protein